jgi:hypothetical protein
MKKLLFLIVCCVTMGTQAKEVKEVKLPVPVAQHCQDLFQNVSKLEDVRISSEVLSAVYFRLGDSASSSMHTHLALESWKLEVEYKLEYVTLKCHTL